MNGKITWQTTCEHISREYYQIVARVTDELSRPSSGLATLRTIRIKVVAPPPLDLDAVNENGVVTITWSNPYLCETGSLFQGFSIWRKLGSSTVQIDTCVGGLEGKGYERIIFLTSELDAGSYIARDAEINPGEIYCYRVLAEFAELTESGNPYNTAQSIASEEVCIRSSGDEPLITNVSILNTDNTNGSLKVQWINPDADAIDTTLLVGPYMLTVAGTNNLTGINLQDVQSFSTNQGDFSNLNQTMIDVGSLDTKTSGHSFQISFSSGNSAGAFESFSDIASSIFLSATGTDESVILTWEENVPWNNYLYKIYEVVGAERIFIDSTSAQSYKIEGLENGKEHCYLIEAFGTYNVKEVPEPLINFSNETCGTAMDDVAPCPPGITVNSICDEDIIDLNQELKNTIHWTYDNFNCLRPDDIQTFRIYFSERESDQLNLLEELDGSASSFPHILNENIAGCYALTAVDFSGNESEFSSTICVDNCPTYILPNTFTPNNDNANDFFIPRQNRFIDRVEFKVFNRWGQKVFETVDPLINWDGTNQSNKELAEGTYYYTCQTFEKRVAGVTEGDILNGTIQLIR